jgi:hypothetical protein
MAFVCVLLAVAAAEMSTHDACVKVRETLGPYAQCHYSGESLIFTHDLKNSGSLVKFYKETDRKLKVQCLKSDVNVDLAKLPKLNFYRINEIEMNQCLLSNTELLSAIKLSFGIEELKKLTITNEINSVKVTGKLFENLRELEVLRMTMASSNTTFDENSFESLKNLMNLTLNVYDIIALPPNVFVPLEKVENLVLTSSSAPKPEAKKFNIKLNSCHYLKNFTLVGVRWPLQIETMVSFVGPETVSLLNNRLEKISPRAFEKAEHIYELRLRNNSIKVLPERIFASLYALNVIDLSFNLLKNLNVNTFNSSCYLQSIDLSYNRLTSVDG